MHGGEADRHSTMMHAPTCQGPKQHSIPSSGPWDMLDPSACMYSCLLLGALQRKSIVFASKARQLNNQIVARLAEHPAELSCTCLAMPALLCQATHVMKGML